MSKVCIIWGAGGQDGSYLSELLLQKEYRVIGVLRRSSTDNTTRLKHIKGLELIEGDITDAASVSKIISKYKPDHIYNLAAQSFVGCSFNEPTNTFNINTLGVINILEGIRNTSSHTRFIQASTSEMFGNNFDWSANDEKQQTVLTDFAPASPYAVSKVAAHNMVTLYRDAYGLFLCPVIMFNHESPRRAENFVTKKITKWIGDNMDNIRSGKEVMKLQLGNLKASRDWSHAKDFMRALIEIMEADHPDDYVLCSEETHTVEDFLNEAFKLVELDWRDWVEVNPDFYRPLDVEYLNGRRSPAVQNLNWKPEYNFESLVKEMVEYDLDNK